MFSRMGRNPEEVTENADTRIDERLVVALLFDGPATRLFTVATEMVHTQKSQNC